MTANSASRIASSPLQILLGAVVGRVVFERPGELFPPDFTTRPDLFDT
jgi:hypothetical protein